MPPTPCILIGCLDWWVSDSAFDRHASGPLKTCLQISVYKMKNLQHFCQEEMSGKKTYTRIKIYIKQCAIIFVSLKAVVEFWGLGSSGSRFLLNNQFQKSIFIDFFTGFQMCCRKVWTCDLSFASTETKFKNPITKTQNNFLVNAVFFCQIISKKAKMIISFFYEKIQK